MNRRPTLAERALRGYRRQEVALRARPHVRFMVGIRRGRRTHLVAETCSVWRGGSYVRLAGRSMCGRDLDSVVLYSEPPEGCAPCDYCELALELEPTGMSATAILARLTRQNPTAVRVIAGAA